MDTELKEKIIEALKTVEDPELGIDVVSMGLIYDVTIIDGKVQIKMTLTIMGCPMMGFLADSVKEAALKVEGIKEADVEIVFDPPWDISKMTKEARVELGV